MQEKSSNELARELRIRLVCEVAVLGRQVGNLNQKTNGLHSEINDFDKDRKTFLQTLLTECSDHLEKGTFRDASGEVEEKYKQYVASAEIKNEKAKAEVENLQSRITVLEKEVDEALARICEDVLAEKYGRGELILTKDGLQRIIGRISDINESMTSATGITLGKSNKCKATMQEIAWMCENPDQYPPLFFVDIAMMPLNEDELSRICWENEDYKILIKNIPEDNIVWQIGSVFYINRNLSHEVYLIPLDKENVNVVRVNKFNYPNWQIEVLGKVIRNKDNLQALGNWGGYNKVPIELEDASCDYNVVLGKMDLHLSQKYPGIILKKPQIEK